MFPSYTGREYAAALSTNHDPITTQTTPQNVGLSVHVRGETAYKLDAMLFVSVGSNVPGVSYQFSTTDNSRGGMYQAAITVEKDFDEAPVAFTATLPGSIVSHHTGDEATVCIKFSGIIYGDPGSPPAILSLKVAQATASATAIQVIKGSYISVTQLN